MTNDEKQLQFSLGIAAIAISIRCVKAFGRRTGEEIRDVVEQELSGICSARWSDFDRAEWREFVRAGLHHAYDPGGPLGSPRHNGGTQ